MWEPQTFARSTPQPAAPGAFDLGAAIDAELDRVGVSLRTAELGDAVVAGTLGDLVWIMAVVARPEGGRAWEGSERQAFARFAGLPDDAGASAFWEAFPGP